MSNIFWAVLFKGNLSDYFITLNRYYALFRCQTMIPKSKHVTICYYRGNKISKIPFYNGAQCMFIASGESSTH